VTVWRWLRTAARFLYAGCAQVGAVYLGLSAELAARPQPMVGPGLPQPPRPPSLMEPPPGSPERLVRMPPTPVERRLWAELGEPPLT
jgi:hypothetical protein